MLTDSKDCAGDGTPSSVPSAERPPKIQKALIHNKLLIKRKIMSL